MIKRHLIEEVENNSKNNISNQTSITILIEVIFLFN